MSATEQEIIERVHRMTPEQRDRLMEFIDTMDVPQTQRYYTASELMKLPPEERNRLVAESFARAEGYSFEIFEAYSDDDFDDYDQ